MPYVRRDGDVHIVYLGAEDQHHSENRFNPEWMSDVLALLDQVASCAGPAALVTVSTGKYYSNGLDIQWLAGNRDRTAEYLDQVQAVLARLLTFPLPTVAAVNGHAFGAGAMLALAQDFRVMRADRGYWCLPEVRLGLAFTPGMNALVTSRLSPSTAVAAMTTGQQYPASAALQAGIIDELADEKEVLPTAVQRAAALAANHKPNLETIKRGIHASVLTALAQPITPLSMGLPL